MRSDGHAIEERLGSMIVEGQRHDVWVRSEPDGDGTWHNALIFRRDGVLSAPNGVRTGVEWNVPPGIALERARELDEREYQSLYQRALSPKPPLG